MRLSFTPTYGGAMDETHNPEPSNLNDEDKGMKSDPTKLVQAIVADRDFISSISAAIMTDQLKLTPPLCIGWRIFK